MNIYSSMKGGMESGYVLYPSLKNTHPEFATGAVTRFAAANGIHSYIGQELISMASAEESKELAWISSVFGINIPITANLEQTLTRIINELLQTKRIFDRHKAKFLYGLDNQHKAIQPAAMVIGFGSYFNKAVDARIGILKAQITPALMDNPSGVRAIVSQWLKETTQLGIQNMLDSKTVGRKENPTDSAYSELSKFVGELKAENDPTISGIMHLYGIDSLENTIMDLISQDNGRFYKKNAANIKLSPKGNAQKGGTLMEYVMSMVNAALAQSGGSNIHVSHTGPTGVRPDIMVGFGVDLDFVDSSLKSMGNDHSRQNAINKFNEIYNRLGKINEGWIVHENLKNYTLNSGFMSRGGFSAISSNSAIPLNEFQSLIGQAGGVGVDPAQVCNLVRQLIPGSLMMETNGGIKAEIEGAIASTVMMFLFDDIATIGRRMESLQGITGHQIHLFYLDGFYVPLSIYLRHMGQAFVEFENVVGYAKAHINTPGGLRWAEKEEAQLRNEPVMWFSSDWESQKADADSITITMNFLGSFTQFMSSLLG